MPSSSPSTPHAGGAARYAERAFKLPYVSFIVGFLMLASGITTAASLANAFAGEYLSEIVRLPAVPVTLGFIALLMLINLRGVKESLSANVVMTVIEVSGLMLVIVVAAIAIGAGRGDPGRLLEFAADVPPLEGAFAATITAFFSFLGFEAAANMAEEVKNPTRSYPRALFGAIITAGIVYLLIALGASMVVTPEELTAGETRPLLNVVEGSGVGVPSVLFSIVALVAIANGALLFTVMASRATYGLAEAGLLPRSFGRVLPKRRTPWVSILAVGLLTMAMSFVGDVSVLAATTVLVFISANVSVLVLKKDKVDHPHVTVPRAVLGHRSPRQHRAAHAAGSDRLGDRRGLHRARHGRVPAREDAHQARGCGSHHDLSRGAARCPPRSAAVGVVERGGRILRGDRRRAAGAHRPRAPAFAASPGGTTLSSATIAL